MYVGRQLRFFYMKGLAAYGKRFWEAFNVSVTDFLSCRLVNYSQVTYFDLEFRITGGGCSGGHQSVTRGPLRPFETTSRSGT